MQNDTFTFFIHNDAGILPFESSLMIKRWVAPLKELFDSDFDVNCMALALPKVWTNKKNKREQEQIPILKCSTWRHQHM